MPRDTLNRQMLNIKDEVLLLGSMVEQAMLKAVEALKERDQVEARLIYNNDRFINEKRFAIENAIIIVMATQQPMAHDLRLLAAILEVLTELERMGDYAKGIAKVVIRLGEAEFPTPIRDLSHMADLSVSMLHRALTAFVDENPNQAVAIPVEDNQVDDLYNKVYRELINIMIADPATIDHANLLIWVAHNIERMADRVTNICERTVFIATGELLELDSSDEDDTD